MARRLARAALVAVVYATVLALAAAVGGEETAKTAARWMRKTAARKGGQR